MKEKSFAYIQLHLAVLLYGSTAILGDLISISAVSLVWWRVLITSISLLFFINFGRSLLTLNTKDILVYMGIGVIIALHWVTFYGAIKIANASITLAAMATTSLFTSVLEPLITGKKFEKLELGIGLLIIPAMLLIANNIDITQMQGLLVGVLSALLAAIFAIINKKMVGKADAYQICFIEMGSAFLFISCLLPFIIKDMSTLMPLSSDWIYLGILSLFCTTFAFVISLKALRYVSAFDANLVVNLEPVYGILLAIAILKEHKELSTTFYYGVIIILLLVISHPLLKKLQVKSSTHVS